MAGTSIKEVVPTTDADSSRKEHVKDSSSEVEIDIYIDPEREKAALRKFDKFLVPTAFVFLVLSSLDRNNVRPPSLIRLVKCYE
jgi:hypothetical protein